MRGGVRVWRRGQSGRGIAQAVAYAFEGGCDATTPTTTSSEAAERAVGYAERTVRRFVVENGAIVVDELDGDALASWVDGRDPETGDARGRVETSPNANLLYDSTLNAPKSFSIAGMLNPDLADELARLQDRLRDRAIVTWQTELNARRGAGSTRREGLARIEVVELDHARSRSLDPHSHRHMWLNAKVQGLDGKWSNVDSAVAMRFQPIINGEGEIAARTDPEWIAALARHGLTLNSDGEIAELAHLVRPLSRRANQIDANRAEREAQWRLEHPGVEPSAHDHAAFDAWAWAHERPNKPHGIDEQDWADQVRDELLALDPELIARLTSAQLPAIERSGKTIEQLDLDRLAERAIVWADQRSARSNARFSTFDVRAGVAYTVAASGVVAERSELDDVLREVQDRAMRHVTALTDEQWVPGHVKAFRASATVQLRARVDDAFRGITLAGETIADDVLDEITAEVSSRPLDAGQKAAAAIVAGTDRLVTVTGPAGTGKTTLLKVAKRALDQQGRRMLVVAPSKKAANVAGEAIDTASSSLHALLFAYGWRWNKTDLGDQWTRLEVGELDPQTEIEYQGPSEDFQLQPGDRIVVDEAGMMDLHAAAAIADVVNRTGAGLAMVGDHLQLNPVGHSGAMALAHRHSTATTELSAVHRFRLENNTPDTEYAALSLRLREPAGAEDAAAIAAELQSRGLVVRAADETAARQLIVDRWFDVHGRGRTLAITVSTNEEAQAINDAIQQRRVRQGQLSAEHVAHGQEGQRILVGDRIQTRRNNTELEVSNRDDWTVTAIHDDGSVTARKEGDRSDDLVHLDAGYLAQSAHLSYASTGHGIQGTTTNHAITGPGVTGAAAYVGMTRGEYSNEILTTASTRAAARTEIAEAIVRGRIETTIEDSRAAVAQEINVSAKNDSPADARWTDRQARPHGHERNLTKRIREIEKQYERAARVVTIADTSTAEGAAHKATARRLEVTHRATLDALHAEQDLRDQQTPEVRAAEDRERAGVNRTRRIRADSPETTAVSAPTRDVGGPEI